MDRNKRTENEAASEQAPAGPAYLDQADVDRLIAGDQPARQAWERRLRALRPGKVVPAADRIAKASPPAISRGEMAEIAEGRMPEAVRKRLARRVTAGEPARPHRHTEHEAPDRPPPHGDQVT